MAEGAFRVYQDLENPRDIHFEVVPDGPTPIPPEQLDLRDEIDKSLTVLRTVFPAGGPHFEEYFRQLLSLAQAGLVGPTAQPDLARRSLAVLQEQIVVAEGGRIKNQYMKALGRSALMLGVLPIAAAALFTVLEWSPTFARFLLLWGGSMAGVWLSFGTRKALFAFYDLHVPEQDRLEPFVRLFFAGLLTIAIGLLFSTKVLVLTMGSVESWHFTHNSELALLIGMLCGISEKALSTTVAGKASEVLRLKI